MAWVADRQVRAMLYATLAVDILYNNRKAALAIFLLARIETFLPESTHTADTIVVQHTPTRGCPTRGPS